METGKVSYVCVAPEHGPRLGLDGRGLTVHERRWAFCPAGETAGHLWSQVDAASFEDLARATASAARAELKP